jgi:hypothetical protein
MLMPSVLNFIISTTGLKKFHLLTCVPLSRD